MDDTEIADVRRKIALSNLMRMAFRIGRMFSELPTPIIEWDKDDPSLVHFMLGEEDNPLGYMHLIFHSTGKYEIVKGEDRTSMMMEYSKKSIPSSLMDTLRYIEIEYIQRIESLQMRTMRQIAEEEVREKLAKENEET